MVVSRWNRGRALLLALAVALTVLPALALSASPARASGHELCVAAEDPGEVPPEVDIREICARYDDTQLAFAMRVAAPTDPQTDPNWQGDTQITWVFDTEASTTGGPNGQLAVFTLDGTLTAVATIFDHESPACAAQFVFDGVWYRAAFDPRCLDLPTAITFAGHMGYDTTPGDPEDVGSGGRLPAGDHAEDGPLVGPVSSEGWSCPRAPRGALQSAGFGDRLAIPHVHRLNVDCAAHHGIVGGFADNTYRPAHPVRRDQMASVIARTLQAAGVELPPMDPGFTDVPAGSPHNEAIRRLAAAGVVHGGPGGSSPDSFGPGLRVRRDQMTSFIVRALAYATATDMAGTQQAFLDVPPGNAHFPAVNAAAERGLVLGHPDGTFRPAGTVRRDQTATFSVRALRWADGSEGQVHVAVFFHHDSTAGEDATAVYARPRIVQGPGVLRGALEELLEGPNAAERAQGYTSWFSPDTAGMLRDVRIEDGTAYIDFDDFSEIIPNASTSHGAGILLSELEATATQFRSVDRTRYSFEGDEQAFYNWLQVTPPG